ncbi:MAG: M64 family metallopeptidase, partial [Muribaculaceae bacterium]|nr:M64 family metallopeptidase [Muribaculaceae bacterium]
TMVDFDSKWKDMIKPGTPVPTPWVDKGGTREERMREAAKQKINPNQVLGAYEGGGYRAKGIYRPVETCRMRDNYYPTFCPVCERTLRALIDFYTLPN